MNEYEQLKDKQQKYAKDFPMMFAINDEQLKEGMKKLRLNENDKDKIYSIGGGGFIRKTDSKSFHNMFSNFDNEINNAIKDDPTGENFIKDMFEFELFNHEYDYTGDIEPTLDVLELTLDNINNDEKLLHGLQLAKEKYLTECL